MRCHSIRQGQGSPLLLIHGLGSNSGSWRSIWSPLARRRQVIALDLPGFGRTPQLAGSTTIATLADAVSEFMTREGLQDVPLVGSSMGARIVLELARRGHRGAVVALNPGGFWSPLDRHYLGFTLGLSVRLLRSLGSWLVPLARNSVTRSLLLAQLSARPWAVSPEAAIYELRSYAEAPAFDAALQALVQGPLQLGTANPNCPITIGWGRKDRVLWPHQAQRALAQFPTAVLHWFEKSGHFPHWDEPEQTVQLILENTSAHQALRAS